MDAIHSPPTFSPEYQAIVESWGKAFGFKFTSQDSALIRKNPAQSSDEKYSRRFLTQVSNVLSSFYPKTHELTKALLTKQPSLPFISIPMGDVRTAASTLNRDEALSPKYYCVSQLSADMIQLFDQTQPNVMVASQFNALESPGSSVSPLPYWPSDHTQGPRASLQSLSGADLRCAAQELGTLPDAILPVLSSLSVDGRPILEVYPSLYRNGYLCLTNVRDLNHLQLLKDHIESHITDLRLQMQWVKCEATDTFQLQAFCAAPSFQGMVVDWNQRTEKISLLRSICRILVVEQYRAVATIAALNKRPFHLTSVGQGVFNNPPTVMVDCFKAIDEVLQGTDTKVYFHCWTRQSALQWTQVLDRFGRKFEAKID
ncbi:putative RasGEF domain protein [Blattamonas nauphoetae]|uniref:RasGEF domain protein n=1 Tax=Blattamonas nauphoetae TaxID=2049346 RepID=A0ABQ9YCK9_9EUKA|nr:putative RasGEF domain protein [Blattamonas nauphoetae]